MNPDSMASARIVTVKVAINLGLNMDASNVISGMLAPAPPMKDYEKFSYTMPGKLKFPWHNRF